MRALVRPVFLMFVCATPILPGRSIAQQTIDNAAPKFDEKKLQQQLQKHYLKLAQSFQFFADPARKEKLDLRRTPIISWTSIESGFVSGDVFVWTRQGRPGMIGCFGSLPGDGSTRRPFVELHALGEEKLPALAFNGMPWAPDRAGSDFRPIEFSAPADSPARRLTQMRQLSRQFTAQMESDAGGRETLRRLAQPIYRYSAERLPADGSAIDGAIFSYVSSLGTDPEVLLLLEARKEGDGAVWHYAPLRFSTRVLSVSHQGKKVWGCLHYHARNRFQTRRDPYVTELTEPFRIDSVNPESADTP